MKGKTPTAAQLLKFLSMEKASVMASLHVTPVCEAVDDESIG